jgi:hypothetical protein
LLLLSLFTSLYAFGDADGDSDIGVLVSLVPFAVVDDDVDGLVSPSELVVVVVVAAAAASARRRRLARRATLRSVFYFMSQKLKYDVTMNNWAQTFNNYHER